MALREELKIKLDRYWSYTKSCITTVRNFISKSSEWKENRERESKKLHEIKERMQTSKKWYQIKNEEKEKAELQKELEASLMETQEGLKEMQVFLDAVETLAVTSAHVFDQSEVLELPDGADLLSVQQIILLAQVLCPPLLSFKRDNEAFFSPKLENIEVMEVQLSTYATNIKLICDGFRKGPRDDIRLDNIEMNLRENISDGDIERMLSNINKLNKYRMDENSRLLFLFQEEHKVFMEEFKERNEMMLQFLSDVEACAVQLDDMRKGSRISNVVGSSVGLVSGILSIVGLALIPVTAGVSLGLVAAGAGLAVASGANTVVTTVTEAGVNHHQKKKANESFEKFMENVNVIQNSLNEVMTQHFLKIKEKFNLQDFMLSGKSVAVAKSIDVAVDCIVSAYKASTAVASDLPELSQVGQVAARGTFAMSRAVRGGLIALNALFIGVDVFVIAKNSKDLHEGSETKISKFFRARAALWKSEIVSWQKMYESLETGLNSSEREVILREPFY